MSIFSLELVVIGLCLVFLFYLSVVESAITQSSPLTLRMMLEREDSSKPPLLSVVLEDEMQVIVPLHLGTQVSLIVIAILTTHLSLNRWSTWGVLNSFVIISAVSILFRQLVPRLVVQHEPEKKLVALLASLNPIYRMLRSLALPVSGALNLYRKLREDTGADAVPAGGEATGEEIQAYLEIGEDEGILKEDDSKLIQSVVEFGDTLVREVMTTRTKIVACEESATIAELRAVMVQHKHSRIPVYRGDLDHIIGIAYIRQLMAEYARGRDSDPIAGLTYPALFVPETKPVSKLLKELQERGDHAAIVIDEFGGVAGLVTIEDLIEEIVGEIRDEDQAKVSEVVEEGPRSFVVGGSTGIQRLESLAGRKFEGVDCTTAAGLIVAFLGRVPAPGEEFDLQGLHIQVLDADRKRVHRIRVQLPQPASG
ncbi:MAG TPA: hemolysin family protein [Acidobacteriota bacterium]|nr:hemolysin family protein [Acidobacteriota bacterium]